jgi:hypothetical protein
LYKINSFPTSALFSGIDIFMSKTQLLVLQELLLRKQDKSRAQIIIANATLLSGVDFVIM